MLHYNKLCIYEWFQQVSCWNRVDFLCSLLNLCNPWELRFIGSFIEDLARIDYNSLRDQDLKANSAENVSQFAEKLLPVNEFRSHLIVCLALLQSTNYRVAEKLAQVLDGHLKDLDLEVLQSSGKFEEVEECMLMLTLATYHPAFSFDMKLLFKNKLTECEKMIHRRNQRCGRYCRSSSQYPGARCNTVNPDFRTENIPFGPHHQAPNYPVYQQGVYTFVTVSGDQFTNRVPVINPVGVGRPTQFQENLNSYPTLNIPHDPQTRPDGGQGTVGNMKDNMETNGDNWSGVTLSDEEKTNMESINPSNQSEKELIYVQSTNTQSSFPPTSEQHFIANKSFSDTSLAHKRPHCFLSTAPLPCLPATVVTAQAGPYNVMPLHGSGCPATNQISGIHRPANCKRIISQNLERGDVCDHRSPEKDANCNLINVPLQNFKRGDSFGSSLQVDDPIEHPRLDSKVQHGASQHVPTSTALPLKVAEVSFPSDSKSKQKKCRFKVTWSDGKISDCEKGVEEIIGFLNQCSKQEKLRLNTSFLTKQHNQVNERRKTLELYFNDILSSSNTLTHQQQQHLASFFKGSNSLPATSLPLKKRKLKTDSRTRSRVECDSSSSSTSSPPLPSVPKERILSPSANRPASSLSPQSNMYSISGSSALSSPAPSVSNSLMDDDDPQNDPYLKFSDLEISEVESIPGLSTEDKGILKKEMMSLKGEKQTKTALLEIDMGKLALEAKVPDIKDIVDSASQSRSEDEKSTSGQVIPVAFETSDEAVNDSLQAGNSCFSFEFDSGSVTGDSMQSVETSKKTSEGDMSFSGPPAPPSWQNIRRYSAEAQNPWMRRNTLSPVENTQPKVVQGIYVSSTSAPPMTQFAYYPKPRPGKTDQMVLSHPVQRGSPQSYPPLHPTTLPIYTSHSGQTLVPTSHHSQPIFPRNPPSTLPSPMMPTKHVVLSYNPSVPPCRDMSQGSGIMYTAASTYPVMSPMGEMPQIKNDEKNPSPPDASQSTSYYPDIATVHGSAMMPHQINVSQNPPFVTDMPSMPQTQLMYATAAAPGVHMMPDNPAMSIIPDNAMMPQVQDVPLGQSSIHDSEADDQSITSDTDTSPRMPDAMVPSGNAAAVPPEVHFYPNRHVTGQNFMHQNLLYPLATPANMYRVPGQDNSQWPPMQHQTVVSSFSDPNIYSQTKTVGNMHPNPMTVAPMYYVPNGFPETRGVFHMGGPPSTQSGPQQYGKDNHPAKTAPISCYNCGKAGHNASECMEQCPVEILGPGFKLNFSQSNSSKGGNG